MSRRNIQPYPGLRAFERYESRVFFGRQQQTDELLRRLKQHHFLAVIGASGSGKSSLVKAGLLAGLEKGYMGEVGSRWSIAEMRPGGQPFAMLAEGLLNDKSFFTAWSKSDAAVSGEEQNRLHFLPSLTAELRRGSRSFHEILDHSPLPDGTRLLLLVDQFEEIFRFREKEVNEATAFVSLLLEACQHEDIYVVITMRSDFLGTAAEFQGLPEAINSGLYLTPRLTREQLREAICTPASLFGGSVEEALANHLLNEAGNDPDQLPLLQHVLMRLWENDEDKILTLEEYQGMNDLRSALDGHAEQVWSGLDAAGQEIVEIMFRALTERGRDGQDVRRPLKVQRLLELTGVDLPSLARIVDRFRESGRNFLMPPVEVPLSLDTMLDISHESLIRQWIRLRGWVSAEVKKAQMYQRLLDAAERHSRGEGELWHGTDLALALEWQEETKPNAVWAERYEGHLYTDGDERTQPDAQKIQGLALATNFLQQSEQEAKRQMLEQEKLRKNQLSRARQLVVVSFMGFIIATALAAWGFSERNHTKEALKKVEAAAKRAKNAEQSAEIAKKNAYNLVGVTINSLIKTNNESGIKQYIKDVFDAGQKNTLLLLLEPLLAKTESMNEQERAEWRNKLLPKMNDKQIARLLEILLTEKKRLFELEKKYNIELERINEKYKLMKEDPVAYEKLLSDSLAKNPKNSHILAEYAEFVKSYYKDYSRAEALYKRAIAADPNNANNLGNYAAFMFNNRKDYNRAEELYTRAIAADPKDADILGNYANFMCDIRKNYSRAEALYKRAIDADPKHANNLGNYAIFIQTIRNDNNRAEKLYEQAIAADPKHANSLINYAQLKLILGDYKSGRALMDRAVSANPQEPEIKLEFWFYRLAHFPKEYPQAVKEIVNLLKSGACDEGWDFSGNIARAKLDGHKDVALLQALSDVIVNKAKFESLPLSARNNK